MDRQNIGLGAILIAALAVLAAGLPGGANSAPALTVAAGEALLYVSKNSQDPYYNSKKELGVRDYVQSGGCK